MPLARLTTDRIEVPSTKNYMIDHHGTVYAFIEALDAAVESEMLIACTFDVEELMFCPENASNIRIIPYEEYVT